MSSKLPAAAASERVERPRTQSSVGLDKGKAARRVEGPSLRPVRIGNQSVVQQADEPVVGPPLEAFQRVVRDLDKLGGLLLNTSLSQ